MTKEEVLSKELSIGDTVVLYSWEYLQSIFEHEKEYDGVENGNLISPNGYRIFYSEKDLYGKPYKFTRMIENQFDITINTVGKKEISPDEIRKIISINDKEVGNMGNNYCVGG